MFGTEEELAALMPVAHEKRDSMRVDVKESIAGEVILMHPEEIEDKYLELIKHELTRLDVHLSSIRYHVNLGIDYDARGNIVGDGKSRAIMRHVRDIVAAHGEPRRYLRVRGCMIE